jgi:exosortase A-associated hydrolase 1
MRRLLSFDCEGAQLAATLDDAGGTTGLLIVSGGNEIRIGAHRGMAKLARDIAAAGHPVFRFDRRGIGDSEGENADFERCGPDIAAALMAFRAACPNMRHVVAFGNCDAASALVLHQPLPIDRLILANPWVIESIDDLPPPAAIRARYAERLRDPKAWVKLVTGAINMRKLVDGLLRIAKPTAPSTLGARVIASITAFQGKITILLATGDATAIAFSDTWGKVAHPHHIPLTKLDSASHSFAGETDYNVLRDVILKALTQS